MINTILDYLINNILIVIWVYSILQQYLCSNRQSSQQEHSPEAAHQKCSYKKMFRKYAVNLQENTHACNWGSPEAATGGVL